MNPPDQNLYNLISNMVDNDVQSVMDILTTRFDKRLLQPFGRLRIMVVHIAAWRGRMDLLELFHRNGADINATDAIGRCALFYAANRGDSEMVNWLLKQGAYTEHKVRVEKWYRNIGSLFLAECPIGNNLPSPECLDRTALHQAAKNNHSEVVKLLVEVGADVNAKDERGCTPLLLAGSREEIRKDATEMSKFVDIVKTLVSANASATVYRPNTGTTMLHLAAELGNAEVAKILLDARASPIVPCRVYGNTPLHTAASAGNHDVLLLLLEKTHSFKVDITNRMKQTALYLAACEGHDKCAKALINHGGNLAATTDYGETVMDVIFTHVRRPEVFLTDILDSGVQIVSKSTGKNLRIIVNFNVLTPEVERQMAVVMSLIAAAPNVDQLAILQHPLLETFLFLKWSRLRVFFFTLIFVHAMFVFSLSGYTIMLLQYEMDYTPLKVILTFTSSTLLLHNMAQVLMVPKYYLRQFEMWMSYACATVTLMISLGGVPTGESQPGEEVLKAPEHPAHSEWRLHSMSVAILLGWIQMMLIVGRLPICGYYALMFSTVLRNFLKVLAAFIFLIVGFALSFTVVFHQNDQFQDSWTAFVKTLVMMTGEFDYEDIFTTEKGGTSPLLFTGKAVFLAFIMLVSITLMNLMIGLAVNDIQDLEKQGHIDQLLKQAEFVSHLEGLISHPIFHCSCLPLRIQSFLNLRRNIPSTFHFHYHKCNSNRSNNLSADISAYQKETLSLLAFRNSRDNKSLITSDKYKCNDSDGELTSLLKEVLSLLRSDYGPKAMGSTFSKPPERRNTLYRRKTMNV
ncbi:transient receptor potential cation channel subfamily A member 1 homolog [Halictus rubicundus]|uniref:transient receptor potential cation channel subfamily A member 1 homolog n=1 Tax=Halictus rubicundus TaxID=77578 RepID=UPI0040368178